MKDIVDIVDEAAAERVKKPLREFALREWHTYDDALIAWCKGLAAFPQCPPTSPDICEGYVTDTKLQEWGRAYKARYGARREPR